MFFDVLYIDTKRIDEYMSTITLKQQFKVENVQVSDDKGVGLSFSPISAEKKTTSTYDATVTASNALTISNFESRLTSTDSFFDFTKYGDKLDITTVLKGSIIKFESNVVIPEKFDVTQIIGEYSEMLTADISSTMKVPEMEAFKKFMDTSNSKIPVVFNFNNNVFCSKIQNNCLVTNYSDLEELENDQITILARVVSSSKIYKTKPFFDAYKDFLNINRKLRRKQNGNRPEGLDEIYVDDDYKMIEIIAIYN